MHYNELESGKKKNSFLLWEMVGILAPVMDHKCRLPSAEKENYNMIKNNYQTNNK